MNWFRRLWHHKDTRMEEETNLLPSHLRTSRLPGCQKMSSNPGKTTKTDFETVDENSTKIHSLPNAPWNIHTFKILWIVQLASVLDHNEVFYITIVITKICLNILCLIFAPSNYTQYFTQFFIKQPRKFLKSSDFKTVVRFTNRFYNLSSILLCVSVWAW